MQLVPVASVLTVTVITFAPAPEPVPRRHVGAGAADLGSHPRASIGSLTRGSTRSP
jgi:hypothetical protein